MLRFQPPHTSLTAGLIRRSIRPNATNQSATTDGGEIFAEVEDALKLDK